MTIDIIRFSATTLCFVLGAVFLCISLFGTFRLNYSLNKLHAAAICDTLVLMFFITGCIIASGINITSFKFFLIIAIQWCASPLVSHIFVKAKYLTDEDLGLYCDEKINDDMPSGIEGTKEDNI